MTLSDEEYVKLQEICRKTPHELREAAHSHVAETMGQLQRWKRDDLIPFLFSEWLEKREDECG